MALRPGDPSVLLPVYTRLSDAEENERIRLAKEAPEKTDALSPRDLSTGVQHANVVSAAIENRAAVVAEIADVSANISYRPLDAAHAAGVTQVATVVGHAREQVIPLVEGDTQVVVQEVQNGTAGAVLKSDNELIVACKKEAVALETIQP